MGPLKPVGTGWGSTGPLSGAAAVVRDTAAALLLHSQIMFLEFPTFGSPQNRTDPS